jgi:hypothetical protein
MASLLLPPRATAWRLALVAWLALVLAGLAGVARAQDAGDPDPIRQEISLGAVRVTLAADRTTIPIDGHIRLTLAVEAPPHTVVTLPEIGDDLGPFVVASQSALGPSAEGAGTDLWRREYLLEAESVGELIVPPLTVTFQEQVDPEAPAQELRTEPLAITVTSVLPADVDIAAPKDIAPPLPLPRSAVSWLPWLLGGLAIGLAALAVLAWRRWRRRRPPAAALRPAHLLALAELERLQGQLPADQRGSEEVYVRLADILRRYVVWRFGLRADAKTTEELLASAERSGGPIAARRHLIGPVLAACDLVKFARHRPRPGDLPIQLRQARDFIEQTADEQVRVAAPAAGAS